MHSRLKGDVQFGQHQRCLILYLSVKYDKSDKLQHRTQRPLSRSDMKSENIGLRASVEFSAHAELKNTWLNRGAGVLLPLISIRFRSSRQTFAVTNDGSRNEIGEAANTQDMHTFVSRQSQSCLASVIVILTKHRRGSLTVYGY